MTDRADTENCYCAAIRQAARQVTQFYDVALAGTGLRTTQFSLLARLRREGPTTINDLARCLVMDRTTLGRNLLPLQRDGLVSIEPSKLDRRSKEVDLTKLGRQRLAVADARWSEAQRGFEEAFGRRQSTDLRDRLRAVVNSVGADLEGEAGDE